MASMTVEITTTRDIARQVLRHRSFAFQEFSQRYAVVDSAPVLREARLQDAANRQASTKTDNEPLQEWWANEQSALAARSNAVYERALRAGIAKEVARAVLPEGLVESKLYMAGTVRSFIHYCAVRCDAGTQKEHRDVALAIRSVLLSQIPALSNGAGDSQ